MADKERRINERSLENLKLGAQARYQGKIRQNVSILPETLEWLKCSGNASGMIDDLVAAARNGGLKSNYTHQQIEAEQSQSISVYEQIEVLKVEADQLRAQLAALEQEKAKLQVDCNGLVGLAEKWQAIAEQQQPDYEAARARALARLKLGRQAPEYKRAKKAMDLLLDELLQ